MKKVLLIEESALARLRLKQMLERNFFDVIELAKADGFDEFAVTKEVYRSVDVIILNINLPRQKAFAVLESMRDHPELPWPPVLIMSSLPDKDVIRKAVLLGAQDCLLAPFVEGELIQRIDRLAVDSPVRLILKQHVQLVDAMKEIFQAVQQSNAIPLAKVEALKYNCRKLVDDPDIMNLFIVAADTKEYTFRHTVHVGVLAGLIGKWIGLKEADIDQVMLAGLLHDIGKAYISEDLLNKKTALSPREFETIQQHPQFSYNLLKNLPVPPAVLEGIIQHHERLDGSGYPCQLLGRELGLFGKIIAVADCYDAMTSNKVYRQAELPFFAIEELMRDMFDKLDPHICAVFLKNLKESLVGQIVCFADGQEARIAYVEEQGFAGFSLQSLRGEGLDINVHDEHNIVKFMRKQ